MRATTRQIRLEGDRNIPPLPILALDSGVAGPEVVITANIHGDETTGLAAIHRLAETLGGDGLARGRVTLFPTLNPAGLAAATRAVPGDGSDLNRAFPGKAKGRTSERLARRIWQEITEISPSVLVDLHADAASSIPYALLDRPVDLDASAAVHMQRELDRLGAATGLTVVREYPPDTYIRYGLDRSLAGALVNRAGIPTVTIEAGPRRLVDAASVDAVLHGLIGLLGAAGVRAGGVPPHPSRVDGGPWRRHAASLAHVEGWLDPRLHPGDPFRRGDVIARIRATDGRVVEQVQADTNGIVLSWIESTWITAGTVVATLAVRES
jgi:predicted deacylase